MGNPQPLLDTMLFINGLYFALCGRKEHRQLQHYPSQIELIEKPREIAYLIYKDVPKNYQGGLKNRKIKPQDCHAECKLKKSKEMLCSTL